MPAGPRTAGRPFTYIRHLARKLGAPDGPKARGTHTPPPFPSFACVILAPRSGPGRTKAFARQLQYHLHKIATNNERNSRAARAAVKPRITSPTRAQGQLKSEQRPPLHLRTADLVPQPRTPLCHKAIARCKLRQDKRTPSPTPSPTDPVPAGPRTAGRPRTRHLARMFGFLDAQNTRGSHTPPPPPIFACDRMIPRSSGLGGRSSALLSVCRTKARHGIIEPTRQRPRHRDGRPRAARICGGRLPRS